MLTDSKHQKLPGTDERQKNGDELSSLMERYAREKPLLQWIQQTLGVKQGDIFICSTDRQTLLLQTANGTLASHVRMNARQLLLDIEKHELWHERFSELKVQVRPLYEKRRSQQAPMRKISRDTAQILVESAESIDNPKLSAILKRLAKHARD